MIFLNFIVAWYLFDQLVTIIVLSDVTVLKAINNNITKLLFFFFKLGVKHQITSLLVCFLMRIKSIS